MLYIAFVTRREDIDGAAVTECSERWWNQGARPETLTSRCIYGAIGSGTNDVFVFETDRHEDLQTMVNHWRHVAVLDIHPAVDLAEQWRSYGMNVE